MKKSKRKLKKKRKAFKVKSMESALFSPVHAPPEPSTEPRSVVKKDDVLRGWNIQERGRQLDKLVAKEVLDWLIVPQVPGAREDFIYCHIPGCDSLSILPLFSTSDHAAIDLYMMLRSNSDYSQIKVASDYYYCFDVVIRICELQFGRNSDNQPAVCVTRESFPLAMCLAALEGARYLRRLKEANHELRDQIRGKCGVPDQSDDRGNSDTLRYQLGNTPTLPRPTAC